MTQCGRCERCSAGREPTETKNQQFREEVYPAVMDSAPDENPPTQPIKKNDDLRQSWKDLRRSQQAATLRRSHPTNLEHRVLNDSGPSGREISLSGPLHHSNRKLTNSLRSSHSSTGSDLRRSASVNLTQQDPEYFQTVLEPITEGPEQTLSWTDPIPLDPSIVSGVLPSGLKYYVKPSETPKNRVFLKLVVRTGSVHEEPHELGVAHLLEHLAFRRTLHFSDNEITSYLQSIGCRAGADTNALTFYDSTEYFLTIPITESETDWENIEKGILILSDMAMRVVFTDSIVEQEKKIVYEEWRMEQNAKSRRASAKFQCGLEGTCYKNRTPIGSEQVIKSVTRKTVEDFYKKWYRLNRMAIIAVGDFGAPEVILTSIRQHFGTQFYGHNVPLDPLPPIVPEFTNGPFITTYQNPEDNISFISLMFRSAEPPLVPNLTELEEFYSIQALTQLLNQRLIDLAGQMAGKVLEWAPGEERWCEGVRAFDIQAACTPGSEKAIIKVLFNEIARLKKHTINQFDYDKLVGVCNLFQMPEIRSMLAGSSELQAEMLKKTFLYNESFEPIDIVAQLARQITSKWSPAGMNQAALRVFNMSQLAVYIDIPKKAGNQITEADVLQIIKESQAEELQAIQYFSEHSIIDPTTLPPPGTVTKQDKVDKSTRITLSNGVVMTFNPREFQTTFIGLGVDLLLEAEGEGLADAYINFPEKFASAALSFKTASNLGLGVNNLSQSAFEYGVILKSLELQMFRRTAALMCLPNTFESLLQILYRAFTSAPDWTDESIEAEFTSQISMLETDTLSPEELVQQKVTEITYNNSPLLRPPTVKDYEQADPAWMKQFIKKSFSDPSAFMWNFTGDFKNRMDEMIPLLEKYIGCIPIPKSREYQGRVRSARCKETIELVSKAVSFPPGVQTGIVYHGNDPQAVVEVSIPCQPYHSDLEGAILEMFEYVLEAKLYSILRHEMNLIYGIQVGKIFAFGNSIEARFSFRFVCDPKVHAELSDAIIAAIISIRRNGLDDAALSTALHIFETQQAKANTFQRLVLFPAPRSVFGVGLPPNITSLEQVFADGRIKELANKVLTVEKYTVAVMLPESYNPESELFEVPATNESRLKLAEEHAQPHLSSIQSLVDSPDVDEAELMEQLCATIKSEENEAQRSKWITLAMGATAAVAAAAAGVLFAMLLAPKVLQSKPPSQ